MELPGSTPIVPIINHSPVLRRAIADNIPWDQVVRRMIAGQGSNLENGLLNIHVLHRDPAAMGEAVAVTFIGQSIGCARCHNHPQDQGTQDQYLSFANLFGRTLLKQGGANGEIVVVSQSIGDIPHLRTGFPPPPTPLAGKPIPKGHGIDRREYLANWMTDASNPYFARTHVNRLWRHLLGRGLVEPDDDLRATNPPVHPELLDYLAETWIKIGYDNRKILKLIVQSDVYQRESYPNLANPEETKFFTRYYPKRMEAEVLLDAYSQVLSSPTVFESVTPGGGNGSITYKGYPLGTRAVQLPDTSVVSSFLDTFGRPVRLQACSCERGADSSVAQALQVNNGPELNEKLRSGSNYLNLLLKDNTPPMTILEKLFARALGRQPVSREVAHLLPILITASSGDSATRRAALEDVFWAVLASSEFMLNK